MTTATVDAEADGGHVRVTIKGEIDLANADVVQNEIYSSIGNDAERVSVDLTEVTYLDSSGLRVLFTLAGRLKVLQMDLDLVVAPASPVRRVMEMSGFEPLARVRDR
ncbi:STAS domain-containing protein [Amycolatopsis thermophila]|uniref:Anti-sigma factor antagonist n=1 Tax=Amycolatopsis thermophila TaxID=206084 RepID=A0ABU0EP21_9PSEU|nr:STAS domain-containing protein [Amycolatopsis thermophila]MDQ0377045.1 anti-sigma B factor antagonist/stage II sporulation protein AA (anti-sigma F factor antagonist) [Amycolatopsis thermophila]